jgi:pimeloyl-ACP methyl ester carboxylesterase
MNRRAAVAAAFLLAGCASSGTDMTSGFAPVNGIRMYYEIHGARPPRAAPLVLLHGGGSTIDVTFGRAIPHFSPDRTLIGVEEQGHGRTTDRDAPVRFETSADDVAALLDHLQIAQADVFGFSNGASVALQLAIRHPEKVRRLVFASSMTKRAGAQPQLWDFIGTATFDGMPQPLKDAFLRVTPDPQKLRAMQDKDLQRMRNFEDVPDEQLRGLRARTLVLVGDRDIVRPEHALELTRLIPDSRLLVVPGTHGDYIGEAVMTQKESATPAAIVRLIEEFLDAP